MKVISVKDNLTMRRSKLIVPLLFLLLSLSGCGEKQADTQNIAAEGGRDSVAVKTSALAAGDVSCINGGTVVHTGIDSNGNGILDDEEIKLSETVCNTVTNIPGQTSNEGFNSLVFLSQEPFGLNCAAGGIKIESGLDANRNNVLEAGEVNNTEFVCNTASSPVNNVPVTNDGTDNTTISTFDQAIFDAKTADDVVKGGLLYDTWWKTASNATEPVDGNNHPWWPPANTAIQNSDTWRCKECHGWDYRGRDGAYQSGAHYTGHPGIVTTDSATMTRTTAESVYAFLTTDSNHGFANNFFTDDEYYDLTKFILAIRSEADSGAASFNFIEANKRAKNANTANGKSLFEGTATCSVCHGIDGKLLDFNDGDPAVQPNEFVHDIALDNPWEFVHKIRFGQPGSAMSGLYNKSADVNTIQNTIDILGYAQTSLAPDVKRGGLLYDKWWATVGVKLAVTPTTRNPIWSGNPNATQDASIVSDEKTWRCASCHGWDYLGVNGALGDTTENLYSGIKGFSDSAAKGKEVLIDAIANGNCTGCDPSGHSFANYLSEQDIETLADFILNLASPEEYNAALNSTNASGGQLVYTSATPGHCESCHGADGKAIPIADISAEAINNPQEFLHKVRYGEAGTIMTPPTLGFLGLSLNEAGSVLAYGKSIASGNNNVNPSYANASVQRGGRLYDKWWVEMQASNPNVQKPGGINLFFTEGQNRGTLPALAPGEEDQSWRCKTCHAWDYKGVGYFTGSSTDTGADNLLYKINLRRQAFGNAETEIQQHFFNWIKTGYDVTNHQFGVATPNNPTPMQDQDIWDIVKFLLEGGLINTSDYILNTGIVIGADLTNGNGLYNGTADSAINCSACHGIDGNTPPGGEPLDIFALAAANNNPWEFVHKVRFGQPGTSMPGTTAIPSLTDQDAYDILGYAQKRFNDRSITP